ncbi:MAG TPA: putative nucleotidyltransferase substrate binding domain-containing protein, partial [Candidatus Berkiella sp.]|nr:putative nucleotidyltransferase substrate binding domain-containing protein [Candidatus Berkiella sp.]
MSEDIISHIQKGKSIFVTGKLGKTLDIKRELYRFVEQFVTNLGFYHQLDTQNTFDIVQQLKAKGILSPLLADKMSDFIQFSSGLRLKEQSVIKRQGFAAYFDQTEFDEDKEDLEEKIQLAKDSIAYMETLAKKDPNAIAAKKRDLVKLEDKYHHMLDMAPGKIFSSKDIELLKNKYLPIGQEIFKTAQAWTQDKERLGFDIAPVASTPAATVSTTFTPAMKNAMNYMHQHPNGFFPALAKLKQEQSNLTKDQFFN